MDLQQCGAGRRCGIRPLSARFGDDDVGRLAARVGRDARRGRLQGIGDGEDAVDADRPVDHRRPHARERRIESLACGVGHGGAHGFRSPKEACRGLRTHAGERLDELDRVAASEVRRHALVARRLLGAACDLTHCVDQQCFGEPREGCDGGHLLGEFGLGCTLEHPLARRVAHQRRGLRVQVVESLSEEVHTPHFGRGVRHCAGEKIPFSSEKCRR